MATATETEKDNEKDVARKRLARDGETEEQTRVRREADAARQRAMREGEAEEATRARREADAARRKHDRDQETDEERRVRRATDAAAARAAWSAATLEETQKRAAKKRLRRADPAIRHRDNAQVRARMAACRKRLRALCDVLRSFVVPDAPVTTWNAAEHQPPNLFESQAFRATQRDEKHRWYERVVGERWDEQDATWRRARDRWYRMVRAQAHYERLVARSGLHDNPLGGASRLPLPTNVRLGICRLAACCAS